MENYPFWIRLHPASTDDTLAISVQARMHDPLWMLGRQWQFGELRHDGGATPIDIRVEGTSAPLARMRGGAPEARGASVAIAPRAVPLETLVEREAVSETGLNNLRLRSESGLHLLRMLRSAGLARRVPFWVEACPFVAPSGTDVGRFDDATRVWWDLVQGRVPDGARLPTLIRARLAPGGSTPPIEAAEAKVLRAWLTWTGGRYETPARGPSTWDPEHMEYRFTTAGLGAAGEVTLAAPEYVDGRLEWYHFEQTSAALGVTGQATPRRSFRVPAPLDFAGMPNPRFWTFEEAGVRFDLLDLFARPDVAPSPATMMVLDFALSYSDDWFLVPIVLDAWSLFDATTVAVTDVFGDVTVASHPDGRWNLFRLDVSGDSSALAHVYLAAGPARATEGPALEELHLLADEAANVAWAVERIVPTPLGPGLELRLPAPSPTPPAATGSAGLTWTLTPPPPPGNWFPLMPIDIGRLALGVLWSARTARPAGRLLTELRTARGRLHQEEVPPEGAQVSRRWQSARAIDGTLHFWIGRSKTPRRTDVAPAVRFDLVDYVDGAR